MRRRLYSLASGLSLMLCVATMVLWMLDVSCYHLSPDRRVSFGIYTYQFGWMGDLEITTDSVPDEGITVGSGETPLVAIRYRRDSTHFFRGTRYTTWFKRTWFFKVNVWAVDTLLILVPLSWFFKRCRERMLVWRRIHALCLTCGYSLTGHTSGICPECGTAVAGKVGA